MKTKTHQMNSLDEIQKYIRQEKALKKAISSLTEKLNNVQNQIRDLTLKEIKSLKQKDVNLEGLMTNLEVCRYLKISSSTLYRMRIYNGFPCVKVDGRKNVMFKRSDVDKYLSHLNNTQV